MLYSIVKKKGFKTEDHFKIYINMSDCVGNRYVWIEDGWLYIKVGYFWDGSSVPFKHFIRLFGWKVDKYCKDASLVHDALCQLIRIDRLDKVWKLDVDRLYKQLCLKFGMKEYQAEWRFKVLRKFPNKGIKPRKNEKGKVYDTESIK